MTDKGFKNRAYCVVINNYSEQEWNVCLNEECEFSVFAKEVGESGTPHIQGYLYFKSARAFTTLKKLLPRANLISPPNGSPSQNLTYIQGPYDKDGKHKDFNPDAVIRGDCPVQGKRTDIENVKDIIKESGKMRDVVLHATSYQSVRHAEVILKYHEVQRDWKPNVMWFHGKTGTGKSRKAYELLEREGDVYTCMSTAKWFEGYDAHENVLMDDMRKDFCKFHELLRLLDRYPVRIEAKGGSRQFLARQIIITSCYSPSEMFDTREDLHQLLRRIDVIREFV